MVNLWFVHVSLELGKSRQSKTSRTFYWRKVLIWNWSELSPASANVFAARNETTGCAQRSLRIGLPPKILILSWISLMAKVPTSYKSLLFGAGKHIVATIGKITRRKTQFPTKESSTQYMAIMIIKVRWPLVWPSAVWRDLHFFVEWSLPWQMPKWQPRGHCNRKPLPAAAPSCDQFFSSGCW